MDFQLSAGIGFDFTNIDNDAYLIIIAGQNKDNYGVQQYDRSVANKTKNLLDRNLTTSTLGKVALAGITSPIAQNLASKALPNSVLGRINSSIYDIMADGKINIREVGEDFIGSCTNALDNVATNMGFPTPSSLYTAIMPNGSGVISKDFMNLFSKKNKSDNDMADMNASKDTNVIIVKLKLISSDNEDLGIEIPTRKTEKNFNIATSVNNSNLVRSFEAKIVHNDNKNVNMYDVKNLLKQIRDMRQYIDVYISDKDVNESEMIRNCLLSNLSFSIENKNAINCSIEVTKVPEWNIYIDATLDKSLNQGNSKNAGKQMKKTNTDIKNNATTVKAIRNFEVGSSSSYTAVSLGIESIKTEQNNTTKAMKAQDLANLLNQNKANKGYKFDSTKVLDVINNGGTVIKI